MKRFVQLLVVAIFSFVSIVNAEVKTKEVEYAQGGTTLKGYLAFDNVLEGKRPGILVVHEWWGHTEHARDRARKLAEIGYTALAIDMYGDGKTAEHPKKAGKLMNAAFKNWNTSKKRFNKAKEFLQSQKTVDPKRIGAIGFCFGGAVSIRMARGGADLDGVVAFHSALPLEPEIKKIKASIMVINGAQDSFLKPETVASFSSQMMAGNTNFTYINLKGVRHSFTNKRADEFAKKFKIGNLKYNKKADERSWSAMRFFFERVFNQSGN